MANKTVESGPLSLKEVSKTEVCMQLIENDRIRLEIYPGGIMIIKERDSRHDFVRPSPRTIATVLATLKENGWHINNIYPHIVEGSGTVCVIVDYTPNPQDH